MKDFYRVGLIGSPVHHSKSPNIYAGLFAQAGVSGSFSVIEVSYEDLNNVRRITRNLDAFAVTMPHKTTIIKHLDEVSESANVLSSVNFAVRDRVGRLCGYSTDGEGFLGALEDEGANINNKEALVYGYGGAAAAVCYALKRAGASVSIAGRDKGRAMALADRIGVKFSPNMGVHCDIFVNATPLGMMGHSDFVSFDFLDGRDKNVYVCDLVYSPLETRLLHEAKTRGLIAVNGLGMLKKQAEFAFKLMLERC